MRRITAAVVALLLLAPAALAQSAIELGDVPGSGGNWQYGRVVVDAPAAVVQRWFSEAERWAQVFPDTQWVQPIANDGRGHRIVRFRSKVIGRTLTLRLTERPGLITYDGEGGDVVMQGKILVDALGPFRARVTLQSTSQVHGAAGIFASKKMRRDRALKKFRADLSAIVQRSNAWAATERPHG